jgi:hypothetical protein
VIEILLNKYNRKDNEMMLELQYGVHLRGMKLKFINQDLFSNCFFSTLISFSKSLIRSA